MPTRPGDPGWVSRRVPAYRDTSTCFTTSQEKTDGTRFFLLEQDQLASVLWPFQDEAHFFPPPQSPAIALASHVETQKARLSWRERGFLEIEHVVIACVSLPRITLLFLHFSLMQAGDPDSVLLRLEWRLPKVVL